MTLCLNFPLECHVFFEKALGNYKILNLNVKIDVFLTAESFNSYEISFHIDSTQSAKDCGPHYPACEYGRVLTSVCMQLKLDVF